MAETDETRLLRDLFAATQADRDGVSKRAFLAKHPKDIDAIDRLIAAGEIKLDAGTNLRVPLLGLLDLAAAMPEADSICYLCAHLFKVLRADFIARPDGKLSVADITAIADMPKGKVSRALGYLFDAPIFENWSKTGGEYRDIVLSHDILKYEVFADVISAMRVQSESRCTEEVRYSDDAARAVYEAIEQLAAAGQRAHAGSVPLMAEKIMIERGRGRIESVFANEQIRLAIVGLSQEGKIDAFAERHRDWLINEPLDIEDPDELEHPEHQRHGVADSAIHPYVDAARLRELTSVSSSKWDLTRLVRMCEELNQAFENNAFITCSMLVRSIVDHVPPVFGFKSFGEVANNYNGSKSFLGSMRQLDKSLRNLADGNLHTHIRRQESLPTRAQVTFWADLDKLLEELVRIIKDDKSA